MRRIVVLLIVFATSPILASEPGQPLDLEDIQYEIPGLSAAQLVSAEDCVAVAVGQDLICNGSSVDYLVGPDSCLYRMVREQTSRCGGGAAPFVERHRFVRVCPGQELEVIAELHDRCVEDNVIDGAYLDLLGFDQNGGRIYFLFDSKPKDQPYEPPRYNPQKRVTFIAGLTTQFEIFQTYGQSTLSFRVPVMPESFNAADWFDTYYGDLATVGDWSQAQLLQCGYPATPPAPGDYLTVADPLPDPVPGQGRYYITAVNYQGQRRYGRKNEGGVLSGRDPALLTACE